MSSNINSNPFGYILRKPGDVQRVIGAKKAIDTKYAKREGFFKQAVLHHMMHQLPENTFPQTYWTSDTAPHNVILHVAREFKAKKLKLLVSISLAHHNTQFVNPSGKQLKNLPPHPALKKFCDEYQLEYYILTKVDTSE